MAERLRIFSDCRCTEGTCSGTDEYDVSIPGDDEAARARLAKKRAEFRAANGCETRECEVWDYRVRRAPADAERGGVNR